MRVYRPVVPMGALIQELVDAEVNLRFLRLHADQLRMQLGLEPLGPVELTLSSSAPLATPRPLRGKPAKKLAAAAEAEILKAKGSTGWAIPSGAQNTPVLPVDFEARLSAVRSQFEKMRTETPGKRKHKFPEYLWDMAAELASVYGITKVAKGLSLGWMDVKKNFKRLIDAGRVSGEKFPNADPARAAMTEKMVKSWTPERRAEQADRIRKVTAKRQARIAKAKGSFRHMGRG